MSGLRRKRIIKQVAKYINEGDYVLDLGSGNGAILKALKVRGVGVDKYSRPKNTKNLKFYKLDITKRLPFQENTFDACIMSAILEHLVDASPLKEVRRVLKKGGKLIILTPKPSSDPILHMIAKARMLGEIDHFVYYTKQGLESSVKKHGFRIIESKSVSMGLVNFCLCKK